MSQRSARETAVAASRLWRKEKRFADSVISRLLDDANLSPSDRAFALDLFYGVLRNVTLLDFWIGCLRASHVENKLRDILRLGMYQIFLLKTPEHAAVHETVAMASKKQRPIINAILRNATRQQSALLGRAKTEALFIRTSHPQFLVERWLERFGAACTEKLCEWNNRPPPMYGRINLLKVDVETFSQRYPGIRFVRGNRDFVEFTTFSTAALESGDCYIQDPSTALACRLLDPKPGEKILDACAAPGGKAAYLAQLMQNQGVIIACDRDRERLDILKSNVSRLDAVIVRPVHHDWRRDDLPEEILSVAPFDRILLDAPCTNTGVIRRRVDVRWRLRPDDFSRMANEQLVISSAVLRLLKPGGVLVYSTCSLEAEENESLVRRLRAKLSTLQLEAEKHSLPFRDGFDGAFAAKLNAAV